MRLMDGQNDETDSLTRGVCVVHSFFVVGCPVQTQTFRIGGLVS